MKKEDKSLTVIEMPAIADDQLVKIANQAEKRIEAITKIKKIALKMTNAHDWVSQNDKPFLQASGAEKIARLFGISWRISEPIFEELEGGHFMYSFKGEFALGNATVEVIGSRSSRDGFFTRYQYKEKEKITLPPSEIDRGDVKKAAFTNLLGNGITRILGIRNLTWDDLLEFAHIKKEQVTKVEYHAEPESKEITDIREKIRSMILEIAKDDAQAKTILEESTTFVPKGKTEKDRVKGKSHIKDLTEAQLNPTYGKIKEIHEIWEKKCKPCVRREGCLLVGSMANMKMCEGPFNETQ